MTTPPEMGEPTNLDEVVFRRIRIYPVGADARRDKWIGWIGAIGEDITDLAIARMAWRAMTEMWRTHKPPLPNSFVFTYFANTYVRTQAVGIRRQIDMDQRNQSLARLLDELSRHPDRISSEFFIGRYRWGDQWRGAKEFEKFDPTGSGQLDPKIPRADKAAFITEGQRVKDWVNEHVAHLAVTPTSAVPTFDELDSALDLIETLYKKWLAVLTGADLVDVAPVPQYDWTAPFRQAWIL